MANVPVMTDDDGSTGDGSRPLAVFKDLCLDAVDDERMSRFWAAALGLERTPHPDGSWSLRGPTPQHGVWINRVAEPVTVKHRVHIDVHAAAEGDLEALGAARLPGEFPWTLMSDPEGGELCVFVREEVPDYRLYEVVVDAAEPALIATWWATVLGARLVSDERGFCYLESVPGAPFESIDFVPVPEPKTVKNRVHWDVTGSVDDLLVAGGVLLRAADDEISWNVMADPEGNEFCVFAP